MNSQGAVRSGVYGIVLWKVESMGHDRLVNVIPGAQVPEGKWDDYVLMAEHNISRGSYGPQQIGEDTDWELSLATMPVMPNSSPMAERLSFKAPHDQGLKIFEKHRSHWVNQGNERHKFQREVGLELQRGWLAGMRSPERTFSAVVSPLLADRAQVVAFSKTALGQSKIGVVEAMFKHSEGSTSNHLATVIMLLVQMYEVSTVEDLLIELWNEELILSSLDFVELLALRREDASIAEAPLSWQVELVST